jgi:flagellar biosynthesis regulator FlaF
MHSSIALDIRKKLAEYLSGRLALDDLKDWFVGATHNVDQTDDMEAIDLTYEVWHAFAEFDVDQNANELRQAFEAMIASGVGSTSA